MHIKNARRILCLGPSGCYALTLVKDLTGSQPQAQEGSIAGLSHELKIKTRYYSADVPIWLDEVTDHSSWQADFTKPEAKQVVNAIAAWIVCYTDDGSQDCVDRFEQLLLAIDSVITEHNDSVSAERLAVVFHSTQQTALPDGRFSQFEDFAVENYFELIDYYATGNNDSRERQGIARIKEALEATDWAAQETDDNESNDFDLEDPDIENAALKTTLLDDVDQQSDTDEAVAVDNLEAMLGKLLAVKEHSADLPLDQRKRLAAKAVREVMQSAEI